MQAGVLLTLFFAWNISQMFEELEAKRTAMIHHVKVTFTSITGALALTIVHSIFSAMVGLIVEISCCSLFITLRNGLKMSGYEVYWLTDFPLIIYQARAKK